MPLQEYSADKLTTAPININLSNVSLNQGQIFFNGNYKLNFSSILSGATDVCTKNYSNFYLTQKSPLSNHLKSETIPLKPKNVLTSIRVGTQYLNIVPISTSNFLNYDYYFNLEFTDSPKYNQYFNITFVNEEYCTISYNDGSSLYYLVIEGTKCILKKAILLTSEFDINGPQYFKYILNDTNLFLIKDNIQVASVYGSMSCVSTSGMSPDTFRENYFSLDENINIVLRDKISTDYIEYTNTNLDVNIENSQLNLSNNFLLYRNLDKDQINNANIILLKNQMSDSGRLIKGNNLSYYTDSKLTDHRNYTSIFNSIDAELDEGLELNYIHYNKSINIKPGINRFKTGESFLPFTQLNINDTTFINSGAFPFSNPLYSDKIYLQDVLSDDTTKTYLCTWLSGSPYGGESIWVDRYYYPNLITKRGALSSTQAFNTTYNTYLESLILTNANLSSVVSTNYYFDKKSDMVFRPNTEYVYERFDINSLNFDELNIYGTEISNYYTDINTNYGFTLQCTLINIQDTSLNTIATQFNDIEGGINISYNNTTLFLNIALYDQSIDYYVNISKDFELLPNIDNNIILHVNSAEGIIYFYINGNLEFTQTFYPLYYKLLYGDFYANNTPIIEYVTFLDDVFLTTSPLTLDQLTILSIRDIINYTDSFNITLPCGMRNSTDGIVQLNSITTNQKSKSNTIDVNISDIGITDTNLIEEIKNIIQSDIADILPVNTNVNQVNILS